MDNHEAEEKELGFKEGRSWPWWIGYLVIIMVVILLVRLVPHLSDGNEGGHGFIDHIIPSLPR
jgi:hypothetical protein